jgi:hypothetical protein
MSLIFTSCADASVAIEMAAAVVNSMSFFINASNNYKTQQKAALS